MRPEADERYFEPDEASLEEPAAKLRVLPATKMREIATVDLAEVVMRDPEWLLRGFVPAGELTLLVGNGGAGKGPWAALLAAAVTRGKGECQNGKPGLVLWASAEDSVASVLKPRLVAAKADLELIKPFGFPPNRFHHRLRRPQHR